MAEAAGSQEPGCLVRNPSFCGAGCHSRGILNKGGMVWRTMATWLKRV